MTKDGSRNRFVSSRTLTITQIKSVVCFELLDFYVKNSLCIWPMQETSKQKKKRLKKTKDN